MSQHYEFSRNYSSNQKSTRLNDNNDTVKNVFNKIMSEACYPDVILEQLLAEFWGNKKIDHRTGTLIAHLQPILINHYDESNENRYKELSSQKFQDEVRNYYEKYDLETVFRNDRDNELWRIFLYPQ